MGGGRAGAQDVPAERLDHVRRHVGAVLGEFHDGADDDLRLVGRREPDEPAVVLAVGVLRGAGLAGDGEVDAAGCRGGAPLHHRDERRAEARELLGREAEVPRLVAARPARCRASGALPSPASAA